MAKKGHFLPVHSVTVNTCQASITTKENISSPQKIQWTSDILYALRFIAGFSNEMTLSQNSSHDHMNNYTSRAEPDLDKVS